MINSFSEVKYVWITDYYCTSSTGYHNVFVHFASFGISFDMESKLFKDVRMWWGICMVKNYFFLEKACWNGGAMPPPQKNK